MLQSSGFCSTCGYYLQWEKQPEDAEPEAVTRRPLEEPVATQPNPADTKPPTSQPSPRSEVSPEPPPAPATGATCPACGLVNPSGRTLCVSCGVRLIPLPVPPPPRSTRSPVPRSLLLGAAIALAVVAVFLFAALRRDGEPSPDTRVSSSLDRSTITASASSELSSTRSRTFGIDNTLDGDPGTAWNDGAPGPGVGQTLTYRFSRRVNVTSIRLLNGSGDSDARFKENARISEVRVTTDDGSVTVGFADTRLPQEVHGEFGITAVVTLEVLSVYPGSRYEDLAVSEIEFLVLNGT